MLLFLCWSCKAKKYFCWYNLRYIEVSITRNVIPVLPTKLRSWTNSLRQCDPWELDHTGEIFLNVSVPLTVLLSHWGSPHTSNLRGTTLQSLKLANLGAIQQQFRQIAQHFVTGMGCKQCSSTWPSFLMPLPKSRPLVPRYQPQTRSYEKM